MGLGAATLYGALDAAFGRSTIEVDGDTVVLHRELLGSDRVRQVAAKRIRAIDIQSGGASMSLYWNVRLQLVDGDPMVAARYVMSRATAEAIQRRLQELLNRLD